MDQGELRVGGAFFPGFQLQHVNPLVNEVTTTREQESHVLRELDARGKNHACRRVGKG